MADEVADEPLAVGQPDAMPSVSPPTVIDDDKTAAARDHRALCGLLAAFTLAWTLVPLIARWPAAIWDDTMEAWTWGQVPQLGYYKLPPFYAWIAGAWFRILPLADWTGYLLPALGGAAGLLGLWHIAGRFVAGRARLIAVLLATMLPTATYMATLFNANTILLALWPWTTLAFLRSLERRRAFDGAALGLLAAASMLSKYSSALLLVPMLAAALLHPERKAYFRSAAPYLAIAVGTAAMAPHIWWLLANDFPTFKYAAGKVTEDGGRALYKAATVSLTAVGLLLPPALALWLATGRDAAALARRLAGRLLSPRERWLLVLIAGPLVLTLLSGFVGGVRLAPNYLIPTLFLVPVALAAALDGAGAERARPGLTASAGGYVGLALIAAPAIAYGGMALETKKFSDPVREAVTVAEDLWWQRVKGPVRIVAGSELYALALAYYGSDRPVQLTHFNLKEAPWITPERVAAEGLLAICVKGDPECGRIVPFLKPEAIRVERTLQKRALGRIGKPVTFEVILVPPAR